MKYFLSILTSCLISILFCVVAFDKFEIKNNKIVLKEKTKIYKPEIIYFDYDNTIEDNSKWQDDFNYAVKQNLNEQQLQELNKVKLDADKWVFIRKNFTKEIIDKIEVDNNEAKLKHHYVPVVGSREFLETSNLYDIDTYVVSQRWDKALNKLVDRANLRKYFKNFYGTGTFAGLQKPQPEFTEAILKDVKGKGKKCWMIGDARSDVKTAQQLGCLAFIISNEEKKEIIETYGSLIGKKVFFVSYNSLSYLLSNLVLV